MEENIKETGNKIECMVMEYTLGKIVENIKVNM